jgi:protein CpxP
MMVEHHITPLNPEPAPSPINRTARKGMLIAGVLAVALLAGLGGNLLPRAFGQGFGPHFGMRHGGMISGPLPPAQIDGRIDRMTKHMAIELDATADQQVRIASIAKAAVSDLRVLREKAQAARTEALTLLTAPSIDRPAVERLRTEQIALAETASKRIAQALTDAAEVLSPEQRRKVADWITFESPWARWHRG